MNQIVKSTTDALTIGETFFKSGMFADIKSAQQAVVKIMAGAEMGISPFQAMSGIHIIQGKPTIGAGIIASRVKSSGKYNYIVTEMNDQVCSIAFKEVCGVVGDSNAKGWNEIGTSTFTIEDAKKAGTKNLDKFPRNMLFSRAISNGVKWFCPDIYEGPVYVPEEMAQVTEDVQAQVIEAPKKRVLNEEQFASMLTKIQSGETLKDGVTLVKDWALENVELTPEQIALFTPAKSNNDFQL